MGVSGRIGIAHTGVSYVQARPDEGKEAAANQDVQIDGHAERAPSRDVIFFQQLGVLAIHGQSNWPSP